MVREMLAGDLPACQPATVRERRQKYGIYRPPLLDRIQDLLDSLIHKRYRTDLNSDRFLRALTSAGKVGGAGTLKSRSYRDSGGCFQKVSSGNRSSIGFHEVIYRGLFFDPAGHLTFFQMTLQA